MENAGENAVSTKSALMAPYFDLEASIEVARTIFNQGGGRCTNDQLVHWLKYSSVKSGAYVTRVSAATSKYFGLINDNSKNFSLSARGKQIVAPVSEGDAASAKVSAFLSVPLFNKVFEEFRGKPLPAEQGIKNLFSNYGVVKDRIPAAVRVFLNSAEQAGFFSTSGDRSRLIQPSVIGGPQDVPFKEDVRASEVGNEIVSKAEVPCVVQSYTSNDTINPAILGLLQKLPADGAHWSKVEKARFLNAFTSSIEFLYPERDQGGLD